MIDLKNIDVVILCGGLGTRLRSQLGETQKTMAMVDERPFMDIILGHLVKQGFQRAILGTGYQAQHVEDYYKDKDLGLKIEFSREEEPLGTGGALKHAQHLIQSDLFFVLNGDSYCPLDYQALLAFHILKGALASIVVHSVAQTSDFGSVVFDETQRILNFREKAADGKAAVDAHGMVNAGIYCFDRRIFVFMPQEKTFSLEQDFFPKITDRDLFVFEEKQAFIDIGTPERLAEAKKLLAAYLKN